MLFRDASGKLLPPIAGEEPDVVVIGTPQHRAFVEAGIEVAAVHPQTLLEQGFRNDFLFELCPNWKEPPKPKSVRPTDEEREAVAQQVAAKIAEQEIASTVSLYEPQEKLGVGKPPVGGFKVHAMGTSAVYEFQHDPASGLYRPFVREQKQLLPCVAAAQPGPQLGFMQCDDTEIGICGTRGSSKTFIIALKILSGIGRGWGQNYSCVLLRSSLRELTDIDRR